MLVNSMSPQDPQPGWLWRTAALAWLLVTIAVGVHQWQFWKHDGIDTDVMALLPVNEQAPDVALATEQLVGQMSRQVVVLLGTGEWNETRSAAQVFRQSLGAGAGALLREDAMAQKTSIDAALGFYQPWRDRLLTPEQRAQTELRPVDILVIAPSQRIDDIAARHLWALPPAVRAMLRAVGVYGTGRSARGTALASYLLFESSFTRELIHLGFTDALAKREEVVNFFGWGQGVDAGDGASDGSPSAWGDLDPLGLTADPAQAKVASFA